MDKDGIAWRKTAYFGFVGIIVIGIGAICLAFLANSLQIQLTQEEQAAENFVDRFMEMPYNQGLYTGMAAAFYELKNQGFNLNTSNLNAEILSPEFYAAMSTETKKHGVDSISCWLIDTGEMYGNKANYDCSIYEEELQRAKEMLKS